MVERRLKTGSVGYYWTPRAKDLQAGCPVRAESLGPAYGEAVERATLLNAHLDAWRTGQAVTAKDLDLQPAYGTLRWLVERYKRSPAWAKVGERNRPHYSYILDLVLEHRLSNGDTLGDAPVASVSARAVDKLYVKLKQGPRGQRTRVPVMCMLRMARAWDVVRRLYPKLVPQDNPWRGVEMEHGDGTTKPATREEAYALHRALVDAGQPWLAVVPLVCFEWHQRPENVLAGHLAWSDYRPASRPNWVRIVHHKTGALVWLPLSDDQGPLFPELTAYLDGLTRAAVPIAVFRRRGNGPAKTIGRHHAAKIVRVARKAAGLGDHVTFAACRHGGLTELGDAELTEQAVMALSGHSTPDAARLYVKRTEAQRGAAARRRRAFIDLDAVSTPGQPVDVSQREQSVNSRNGH
jgi:hypothetical protein